MYKSLLCSLLIVISCTFVSAQTVTIPPGDYLRFTGGTGDINDGVIANSRFGPQGLNIVGVNNNNTIRQIHTWGQITQHENFGTNSFLGNTVFDGNTNTNGVSTVGIGPSSFFRAGAYLTMGHTAQYYFPYIAFNAVLASSSFSAPGNYFVPCYSGTQGSGLIMASDPGRGNLKFYQRIYDGDASAYDVTNMTPSMFLNERGQLGIGFDYMPDLGSNYNYKLAVKGAILATKVRVSQTGPWPDYVFEPDYNLSSLDSVESYVRQHKHLPEMNPAKEIEKTGIDLADNQAILLRKIEELTLYVIQLNKAVKAQQDQIQLQNQQIIEQGKIISYFKK